MTVDGPEIEPGSENDEDRDGPSLSDHADLDRFESRTALDRLHEGLAFRVAMVSEDLVAEDRLLDEIKGWTARLDESVKRTDDQVNSALETFAALVQEMNQRLTKVFQELKTGLEETRQLLDSKRDDLEAVLDSVGQIGKTIRMLSINAQIASAKAGEHGKTFSVVAQEIKGLAHEATQSSNEAFKIMDLAEIVKVLGGFEKLADETLRRTGDSLKTTESQLREVVGKTRQELTDISVNSRTVAETLSAVKLITERLVRKNRRAEGLASGLDDIWHSDDCARTLAKLAEAENVRIDPGFDRLDEIRRRGSVRIAIEPDFKGLSFRMDGSDLRGLDVDYARAFAKWLGVACEFIEFPWDQCTNLLWIGTAKGRAEADLVWSALPPSPRYLHLPRIRSGTPDRRFAHPEPFRPSGPNSRMHQRSGRSEDAGRRRNPMDGQCEHSRRPDSAGQSDHILRPEPHSRLPVRRNRRCFRRGQTHLLLGLSRG